MKINQIKTAIFAFGLFCGSSVKGQMMFSVAPGIQMNGVSVGYQTKKFVPFLGLQLLNASFDASESGKRYDSNLQYVVAYNDKLKITGSVIMPTLGVKYFIKETNKLKTYGLFSLTKVFIKAKIDNPDNPSANDDLQDAIKKTKIMGGQLGFGTEYFFDNNFSLGGEFGFRFLNVKNSDEFQRDVYNPNTGQTTSETIKMDNKFSIRPTYIKVSLNFYFNK